MHYNQVNVDENLLIFLEENNLIYNNSIYKKVKKNVFTNLTITNTIEDNIDDIEEKKSIEFNYDALLATNNKNKSFAELILNKNKLSLKNFN
jgi:hypothetical protein